MELSNSETTQTSQASTDTGSTDAVNTGAADTGVNTDTQVSKPLEAAAENAEAPVYQPNWKFKVLDKEHEVDEWIRSAVKDQETEKKVKELYEKAYGLEPVKASRDKLQEENRAVTENYGKLYNYVQTASAFFEKGDLGGFFKHLGVKDEQVAKYMLEKINRQNLPPEQQQVYNELDAKREAEYYQARQLQEYEAHNQQLATQAREWEVDQWLARPEVSQVVSRYDQSKGAGSFKRLVGKAGVTHHTLYGEDPPAEKVVKEVLEMLGEGYSGQQPHISNPTSNNQEQKLPIIPNVSGKNVSPTQKKVRSIEDLKKIRQDMVG